MKTQKQINIDCLRGFLETDGSFQVHLSGNEVKPVVKFSQKTNSDLLSIVKDFLNQHGISNTTKFYDKEKSKSRAPELLIQGRHNVGKFLNLLETGESSFVLSGVKYRDFLIMQRLIRFFKILSKGEILGLKKSLHKKNIDEPDLTEGLIVPREVYEERFGLKKDASYKESCQLLKLLDKQYELHCEKLRNEMKNNTLKVSPAYISGLIAGNGCYSVSLIAGTRCFHFEKTIGFSMDANSRLTIEILFYTISSKNTISEVKSRCISKKNVVTSLAFKICDKTSLIELAKLHDQYGLVGDCRVRQYSLVQNLKILESEGGLTSYEKVSAYLCELYAVDALRTRGSKRKLSLEEAIEIVSKTLKSNK